MSTNSSNKSLGVRRRACVNCTSVKSKCLPLSPDECQRCNRLGKRCTYLNVVEKRKSPSNASRAKLLEQRLNRVLSVLGEQAKGTPLGGFITQLSSEDVNIDMLGTNQFGQFSLPRSLALQGTLDVIDRGFISLDEAQVLLDNYRTRAIQHFPFVPISSEVSVSSLRTTRPFLFLCIMAVMKFDNCTIQRQIGEEAKIQAHQRVLMQSESSLELLQGLLVYITWYQYFFSYEKQQIAPIAQLCVSLVHNLGLDQNPDNTKRKVDLGPDETVYSRKATRSTDQLRALLGTYFTASWVSIKFRTRCTLPCTEFIRQSCELLLASGEYPSDILLYHLVRINEICRHVCDTFGYDDLANTGMRGELVSAMALQTLSSESILLKSSIPESLQNSLAIKLELCLLDSLIGEVALHDDFWDNPVTVNSFTANAPFSTSTRVAMLFNLIRSSKSLNDAVIECSDEDLWYITFPTTAKVCRSLYCLSNASKISRDILSDTGLWSNGSSFLGPGSFIYDATAIERAADLRGEAKRLQTKFKNLSPLVKNTGDEADILLGFSDMIWAVAVAYEQMQRTEAGAINFSIGDDSSQELGSSEGYLSSTGSGGMHPETVLDFGTIEDGTWEELLAGMAEHTPSLAV